MRRNILPFLHLALAALFLLAPAARGAFHRANVGDILENPDLPALAGGTQPLLGKTAVNVFVFFKPGQEHSRTTLTQLAACARDFAGKSVRWVAVVSDRFKPPEIAAEVKETGLAMPVLIDRGDQLYGRLGVALCPSIGITDRQHKLVADLPFTKVNYAVIIRAYVRHGLKEISDAQLQSILNPVPVRQGNDTELARRHLRYAEKLFAAGKHDKALVNVQASLQKDPKLAAAFALRGRIQSAQGCRDEALASFAEALRLDPSNQSALDGRQNLSKHPKQP